MNKVSKSNPLLKAAKEPDAVEGESDSRELKVETHPIAGKVSTKFALDYVVMHSMPGRLRLRVANLKVHAEQSSACLIKLAKNPGILAVRTNYWCGSAVISYDPFLVSEQVVLRQIDALVYSLADKIQPKSSEISKPSLVVRLLHRLLIILDQTLPAGLQVGLGVAAFAASVLKFPVLITRILLAAAVAPIASRALHTALEEKKVGVDALDGMAAVLMIVNGKMIEAGFMAALIAVGEYIRERTARRCEKMVSDLLGLSGRFAWLVVGKKRVCIPADEVKIGDTVVVYPGDMVPVDGVVISGEAAIDQAKLTGESIPVEVKAGDQVLASTVAVEGKIHVRCEATGMATKAGLVLECIATAPIHETRIQNYASLMADKLVLPIFIGAGLCFAFTRSLARVMSMLIFDFSTGIRIAAPTAVLASMHRAGRCGILIKSGGALERLASVNAIVFDKTGTLTSGEPKVMKVINFNGYKNEEILSLAAAVEQRLHHPASRAIVRAAHSQGIEVPDRTTSKFMRGMGVKAQVGEKEIIVGSKHLMDSEKIATHQASESEAEAVQTGESLAYVSIDGQMAGLICYRDQLRKEVANVMRQLRRLGIKKLIMATGDSETAAQQIAAACDLKQVISRAFPEQKAELVKNLKAQGYTVAVIGDGINDSPALAHADVAISLHGGTEAARHSANVVLTDDDLRRLPEAIKIARSAMELVKQNLTLAMVPNSAGLGLAALGMVGPAGATLLNNGSAIAAALNSLRPLYVSSWSKADPPQ